MPDASFSGHLQIIRGNEKLEELPPLSEYQEAARQRLREMAGLTADTFVALQST
jgi:hypothetical protein